LIRHDEHHLERENADLRRMLDDLRAVLWTAWWHVDQAIKYTPQDSKCHTANYFLEGAWSVLTKAEKGAHPDAVAGREET
jgi:hypothetical protein